VRNFFAKRKSNLRRAICLGKKQAGGANDQIVIAGKARLITTKLERIRGFQLKRIAERDRGHKSFNFVKAILASA
jgi:hypothetical protein